MKPRPRPEILRAHDFCIANREALMRSACAGCFYCLAVFDPKEITEWIDEGAVTALCPHCGIDSLIPEHAGFPLTESFLTEMQAYWFSPAESAGRE